MNSGPLTPAERQARKRAAGYQLSVILSDPEAMQALAVLIREHGSKVKAVSYALKLAASHRE